jgi:hypothetical protein
MRGLLLSSALLILLSSCTLGHYGRLKVVAISPSSTKSIFGENFSSFLFKTNIRIYGNDVSGLLVTKQMEPKDYRIIFTTELGMKLFDFEFKDTSFTLHYCVPQFNRPKLIKTIKEDIEILLMNNLYMKGYHDLVDKDYLYDIREYNFGKYYNYYFTEKSTKQIERIENSKKQVKKVEFLMNDYKDGFPNNIIIKHYNIKLKIELNYLKR